jgi:hypothetical protein
VGLALISQAGKETLIIFMPLKKTERIYEDRFTVIRRSILFYAADELF